MTTTLTIRKVSGETHRVLSARAAAKGMSLQEYLLAEVTRLAAKPSVEEIVDRARARVRSTGTVDSAAIVDALSTDRER